MIQGRPCVELWLRERLAEHRDRVIAEYAYLCARAARRFTRPGVERADLEQTAAIGLIKAVDRYDSALATPFEAYAWLLVLGELMHHVRDHERILRAPRRIRDLERRWIGAERELRLLLGREPSEGDVASYVNATPADVRDVRAYRCSGRLVPIDELHGAEACAQASAMESLVERLTIDAELCKLSSLERRIIRSIYLEGVSVAELADQIGYSRRHVTRLHRAALRHLAAHLRPQ
ncbi:MAG TPA: sigma-70 family RNA polymerase sigma factor [Verrucomicrobiae bacterium]|nr:sigma-70 family RNA polymerase sigma factor [Verrucomicrobiae bacterium]